MTISGPWWPILCHYMAFCVLWWLCWSHFGLIQYLNTSMYPISWSSDLIFTFPTSQFDTKLRVKSWIAQSRHFFYFIYIRVLIVHFSLILDSIRALICDLWSEMNDFWPLRTPVRSYMSAKIAQKTCHWEQSVLILHFSLILGSIRALIGDLWVKWLFSGPFEHQCGFTTHCVPRFLLISNMFKYISATCVMDFNVLASDNMAIDSVKTRRFRDGWLRSSLFQLAQCFKLAHCFDPLWQHNSFNTRSAICNF